MFNRLLEILRLKKTYQPHLHKAGVSGSLPQKDAHKKAVEIYAKMTSYANYREMNGIDRDWILKCIADGLMSFGGNDR